MTIHNLIKYVKDELKQVEDELSKAHERTDGAYFMGKKVVLLDILHKLEEATKNPDIQEENEYTKVFDKMLIKGGKLEGE